MSAAASDLRAFAPGARVRVRDEEWIVKKSEAVGQGAFALHCVGASQLVEGFEATFLTDIDREIAPVTVEDTALVVDTSPRFRKSRLYIETLLRRTPPTDAELHLGHRGALRPASFQLRPAKMALEALRPRILLADGVGLGKTLEVGVLLSELIARGRGDRILVVVMKSMLAQFQKELWTRFTIPLVRLDSQGLARLRYKIPAGKNPFHYYRRAIISIDTLKNERQYSEWLRQARWDAVVIDECHNAINAGTGRHKVARLLSVTTDALILTSATPHNGRPESFATLMSMLDPTAIADPSDYQKEDITGLFVRRFKKDVAHEVRESFLERDPAVVERQASASEEAVLSAIDAATFHTLDRRVRFTKEGRPRDVLFKTTLLKSYLSSPTALVETCKERIRRLEERLGGERAGGDQGALSEDRDTLGRIRELAEAVDVEGFTKLRTFLEDVLPALDVRLGAAVDEGALPRVVVFSERIATLEMLRDVLCARGLTFGTPEQPGSVAVLSAKLPDTDIQAILEDFASRDGRIRLLLASDMASEGINLHHFCSRLVHFDVPWSLIRLEQRNGRIDRFGQTEQPRIRYLLTRSSQPGVEADLQVIRKLIEKESAVSENLGDEGALMGLYDAEREEELVAHTLSAGKDLDGVLRDLEPELEATRGDEEAEGALPSFLQDLFAAEERSRADPPIAPAHDVRLFSDDLTFAQEALAEIAPRLRAEGQDLGERVHPERPELELSAPEDLLRRYEQLPKEAWPKDGRVWLSTDRAAIERAIDASREKKGEWPELQLLWPLHPVMSWLEDRALVSFGRQEAPVLLVPEIEAAFEAECVALVEGTVSNKRGQPVLVDWFGLPTRLGPPPTMLPARAGDDVLRLLAEERANPGAVTTSLDALSACRGAWSDAATQHMQALRRERGATWATPLREGMRKATRWEERARAVLEARREKLRQRVKGRLVERHMRRVDEELARVGALREDRTQWLRETFTTDDRPWVRLVAVLVAR